MVSQNHPSVDQSVLDQFEASFRIEDRRTSIGGDLVTDVRNALPTRYVVQNQTPYFISIEHDGDSQCGLLEIAPFGERVMAAARLKPFERQLRLYRQRHEIRVDPYREERQHGLAIVLMITVLLGVIGAALYNLASEGSILRRETGGAVVLAVVVFAAVLLLAYRREHRPQVDIVEPDSDVDDVPAGLGGLLASGNETSRRAVHILVLVLVVVIGSVLPAIAIVAATDAKDFLMFEGGIKVEREDVSRFTSRVVQMIYVSILSLFPALLYFQFDRFRVGTVWRQWVRAIFRMDERLMTLADLNARYGDELAEASHYSTKSMRFSGGSHSPIVVATTLIALGWTVLVLQTESFDFSAVSQVNQRVQVADDASTRAGNAAQDAENATTEAERDTALAVTEEAVQVAEAASAEASQIAAESQGEDVPPVITTPPLDESTSTADRARENSQRASAAAEATRAAKDELLSTSYFQLLSPRPSAAAMAFLGAYFYAVYLVLRSYFRGDLRPKIYNQITARLVTVVVVAYLINVLLFGAGNQNLLLAMAFFAGVVPRTAVRQILLFANQRIGRLTKEAIATERPLTEIDGVDLYDASLLEAVGISNVSALANSDLVSVMMTTRLPAGQLVDWADQAALMVVLNGDRGDVDGVVSTDGRIACLRRSGIRTATDFVAVCKCDEDARSTLTRCLELGTTDGESLTWHEVSEALRRQPVWDRIDQWRNSPLAVNRDWILLPERRTATLTSTA